ncbi:CBS domain-containing protein [Pelagibius marinus]|uniref:CBS domain-containing protein n=1 Tax=Pelagibius marinus TaxID=2762760 RepID=UPI001872D7CB|nr:CBS domain-containing protein [Pelagibius marinus]
MLVETALRKKDREAATMPSDATLAEAAAMLLDKHVGVIVVCDNEGRVLGIVTDSDIMRHIACCPGETCNCGSRIDAVMTRKVVTCRPDETLSDAWSRLDSHGLRRIPVVGEDEKFLGIINLRDIFHLLRHEKQLEAHEFEFFIAPPAARGEDMPEVLNILHEEHRRIGCVLVCLRHLAQSLGKMEHEVDSGLLSAILDYMDAFPDTIHHPKEERFLFSALRRRRPGESEVIDQLVKEHETGKLLLTGLRATLPDLARDPASRERFRQAVKHYVEFEGAHMRQEERVFMPLAARYLTDADWRQIAAAFRRDSDPLFGRERRAEFEKLYRHILHELPDAPIFHHAA